jgi:hypothetical protein
MVPSLARLNATVRRDSWLKIPSRSQCRRWWHQLGSLEIRRQFEYRQGPWASPPHLLARSPWYIFFALCIHRLSEQNRVAQEKSCSGCIQDLPAAIHLDDQLNDVVRMVIVRE